MRYLVAFVGSLALWLSVDIVLRANDVSVPWPVNVLMAAVVSAAAYLYGAER